MDRAHGLRKKETCVCVNACVREFFVTTILNVPFLVDCILSCTPRDFCNPVSAVARCELFSFCTSFVTLAARSVCIVSCVLRSENCVFDINAVLKITLDLIRLVTLCSSALQSQLYRETIGLHTFIAGSSFSNRVAGFILLTSVWSVQSRRCEYIRKYRQLSYHHG